MNKRCIICGWSLAKSTELGCVEGDCSYRPGDPAEQRQVSERRELVKRATEAARGAFATDVPDDEARKIAVAVMQSIGY